MEKNRIYWTPNVGQWVFFFNCVFQWILQHTENHLSHAAMFGWLLGHRICTICLHKEEQLSKAGIGASGVRWLLKISQTAEIKSQTYLPKNQNSKANKKKGGTMTFSETLAFRPGWWWGWLVGLAYLGQVCSSSSLPFPQITKPGEWVTHPFSLNYISL